MLFVLYLDPIRAALLGVGLLVATSAHAGVFDPPEYPGGSLAYRVVVMRASGDSVSEGVLRFPESGVRSEVKDEGDTEAPSVRLEGILVKPDWGMVFQGEKVPVRTDPKKPEATFSIVVPSKGGDTKFSISLVEASGVVHKEEWVAQLVGFTEPPAPGTPSKWQLEPLFWVGTSLITGVEVNSGATTRTSVLTLPVIGGEATIHKAKTPRARAWFGRLGVTLEHNLNVRTVAGTNLTFPFLYPSFAIEGGLLNALRISSVGAAFSPYLSVGRQGVGQTGFGFADVFSEPTGSLLALHVWALWVGLGLQYKQFLLNREWLFRMVFLRSIIGGAWLGDGSAVSYPSLGGWGTTEMLRVDLFKGLFAQADFRWISLTGTEWATQWAVGLSAGWKFYLAF